MATARIGDNQTVRYVRPMSARSSSARPRVVVLCSDDVPRPVGIDALTSAFDIEQVTAEGLAAAMPGAQVLLLWDFFSTAVADVWDRCTDLEWIHVAAAGVDKLIFDGLVDSDVVVTNARGVFDRPIAEFVLAALLAFVKDIHRSHDLQRDRVWRHRETGTLQGQRVLVVGTGSIGRETARLLRAVGMQVTGVGRVARDRDPDFGWVLASDSLAEHARGIPFLVNIVPLTPGTRGLIDAAVIDAMSGGFIVNVGRGATVVQHDLLAALDAGRLAGAALDVFDEEPLPADHPAWTTPGLVISPHMSGDAVGWRDRLAAQFVDNAERFAAGEQLRNVVDTRLGYAAGG